MAGADSTLFFWHRTAPKHYEPLKCYGALQGRHE
jgi:hypothetical protein